MEEIVKLAAECFYGYGRWDATYYFVGPEPGKAKDEGENLISRCRAWLDLCRQGRPAVGSSTASSIITVLTI